MSNSVIVLASEPGIQRDGTPYSGKNYIDGQWVRFVGDRGVPRKIGGYKLIDQGNADIIRTVYNYDNPSRPNSCDTYLGRFNSVSYVNFDFNGNIISGEVNRTPTGYNADPNNLWDFDIFTNTVDSSNPIVVAAVAPNANDISNTTQGPIYYGDTTGVNANAPLTAIKDAANNIVEVSGGIVFAPPILIAFDNNGLIRWSDHGVISGGLTGWTLANSQTIANSKIIQMLLSRGSGTPQLTAWTNNSIISLTYITSGVTTAFSAVTIDNTITVMSPRSIISHENEFYWMGLKKFYYYNGVVRQLPNTMNADFLFNKINLSQRSKVWGQVIVTQRGSTEIWWHVPLDDSEECNHTIIYYKDLNKWGDTAISRSSGAAAGICPLPMMADNVPMDIITRTGITQVYPLWMHEYGYDKYISANNISAIDSYFEGHIYDFFEGNPKNNRAMRNRRIEPDFLMNGDMTVTVNIRYFPSDTAANGKLQSFGPYNFNLNTQKIDAVTSQGRLVSFRFESNEIGGAYEMGKTLLNYNIGDERPSGAGNSGTGG